MTPSERRELRATDTIHRGGNTNSRFYNHTQPEHWDVDFTGVAAGFFSETVPILAGGREFAAISIVEYFLRYVLQHDACPEHEEDVRRALGLCATAREELPLVENISLQFPGQFSMAAQQLYCDPKDATLIEVSDGFHLPEGFDARIFFETAVLLAGDDEQARRLQETADVHVVRESHRDLELVEITYPSDELATTFRGLRLNPPHGPKGVMVPIGTAAFKPCIIEDGWHRPSLQDPATLPSVELLLDEVLLRLMRRGMKFRLELCELNIGVTFIKHCRGVFPSFYTFLPQNLMKQYKEAVENPRAAPSVLDPDAEDREQSIVCKDV